jgi:hypothetical protein
LREFVVYAAYFAAEIFDFIPECHSIFVDGLELLDFAPFLEDSWAIRLVVYVVV